MLLLLETIWLYRTHTGVPVCTHKMIYRRCCYIKNCPMVNSSLALIIMTPFNFSCREVMIEQPMFTKIQVQSFLPSRTSQLGLKFWQWTWTQMEGFYWDISMVTFLSIPGTRSCSIVKKTSPHQEAESLE